MSQVRHGNKIKKKTGANEYNEYGEMKTRKIFKSLKKEGGGFPLPKPVRSMQLRRVKNPASKAFTSAHHGTVMVGNVLNGFTQVQGLAEPTAKSEMESAATEVTLS